MIGALHTKPPSQPPNCQEDLKLVYQPIEINYIVRGWWCSFSLANQRPRLTSRGGGCAHGRRARFAFARHPVCYESSTNNEWAIGKLLGWQSQHTENWSPWCSIAGGAWALSRRRSEAREKEAGLAQVYEAAVCVCVCAREEEKVYSLHKPWQHSTQAVASQSSLFTVYTTKKQTTRYSRKRTGGFSRLSFRRGSSVCSPLKVFKRDVGSLLFQQPRWYSRSFVHTHVCVVPYRPEQWEAICGLLLVVIPVCVVIFCSRRHLVEVCLQRE